MATPTIYIGLGTTGLRVLEELQRFYYGTFGKNKPDHVEMIFTETDTAVERHPTPAGDSIEAVYTPLESPSKAVEYLNQTPLKPDTSWVPDPGLLNHEGVGAGGMRCFGRLALWSMPRSVGKDMHMAQLEERIRQAHARLGHAPDVHVYVVSSLAGGTGSGTFIDVAYLARFCINPNQDGQTRIYGLFLLPPSFHKNDRMLANAYACLRDLNNHSRPDFAYNGRWPISSRPPEGFPKGMGPYELTTFISPDWGGNQTVDYHHLIKLASVFLFSGSLGFSGYRSARIVDAQNFNKEGRFGKHSFVSLATVMYPTLEIEETVATTFSLEYLQRLYDPANCYGHRIKGDIGAEANRRPIAKDMDAVVLSAFAEMTDAGPKGDLEAYLEGKVNQLIQKDITESPREFIYRLFRSEEREELYEFAKNKVSQAEKVIIDRLDSFVKEAIEDSESLTYGKLQLKRAHDYLEQTANYWNNFQIEKWDKRLRGLAKWVVDGTPRYIPGEKRQVIIERLHSVLELLKMHHLQPRLLAICKYIEQGQSGDYMTTPLPTLHHLRGMITAARLASGEASEAVDTTRLQRPSLSRKRDDLISRGDSPRQIHEHYPAGSFANEVNEATTRFKAARSTETEGSESKQVFDYVDTLWEHLRTSQRDETLDTLFYEKPVQRYMTRLRAHACVPDFDISKFIREKPGELKYLAELAVMNPIMLERAIVNAGNDYPKVIIAPDQATENDAKKALEAQGCDLFNNNGPHAFVPCPDMRNMIVFLDERGDFNPVSDISNIDTWKANADSENPSKIRAYRTGAKDE
jgi:hypothetical protein